MTAPTATANPAIGVDHHVTDFTAAPAAPGDELAVMDQAPPIRCR